MTDLEFIEKHMAERFTTPDPFVQKRIKFLIDENEHLMHRVMCLRAENKGLRGIIELLRNEREGDRDHPGVAFASDKQSSADAGGE